MFSHFFVTLSSAAQIALVYNSLCVYNIVETKEQTECIRFKRYRQVLSGVALLFALTNILKEFFYQQLQ